MNSIAIVRLKKDTTNINAGHLGFKNAFIAVNRSYIPTIVYKNTGQPYILEDPKLFCSISHSNTWGIGTIADYHIGVDIEKVIKRNSSLLSYIISDDEQEHMADTETLSAKITLTWTIKESVMKSKGYGLSVSPKDICIINKHQNVYTVSMKEADRTNSLWNVYNYQHSGFIISIAIPDYIHEKLFICWNI